MTETKENIKVSENFSWLSPLNWYVILFFSIIFIILNYLGDLIISNYISQDTQYNIYSLVSSLRYLLLFGVIGFGIIGLKISQISVDEAGLKPIRLGDSKSIIFGILISIGLYLLAIILSFLLNIFFLLVLSTVQSFNITGNTLWMQIIFVGISVPIAEELFYRGYIYTALRQNWDFHSTALISSVIFAFSHGGIIAIVYSFFYGWCIAWFYEKYKNMYLIILMHMIINLLSILITYFLNFN